MKAIKICFGVLLVAATMSCGHTTKQDNATGNADTMVMKQDRTDSATNTVSTDTTKR